MKMLYTPHLRENPASGDFAVYSADEVLTAISALRSIVAITDGSQPIDYTSVLWVAKHGLGEPMPEEVMASFPA